MSATVTQDGSPAEGLGVWFSRSISGQQTDFRWGGTTDENGQVEIEILTAASFRGASGYYLAKAVDAEDAIVGNWGSIPLSGGRSIALDLPVGGRASITSRSSLTPAVPKPTLTLSFSGVQPLQNGYHLEGWAIIAGAPVTTGKFNVDAEGGLVDLDGNVIPNGRFETGMDLSQAAAIIITIEPDGDVDAIPADTHYLAGGVAGGSAPLTVGHPAALGDDFSDAAGTYILATPTDTASANENSGIWFLDPSSGTPVAGLQLPELPAGWKYEGWAVIDGTPVTTGTFTDPDVADEGAPYSGSLGGPSFPGEDFLNNAPDGLAFPTDLAGGTAVISIEPSPDDAAGPFTLKPLAGGIPEDAGAGGVYTVPNNAAGFPTGTATIE